MTIYADVLFLINFIYNAEIMLVLCKIFSKRPSLARVFSSAAVGALAGVFSFTPHFKILLYIPAQIALSLLMTVLVFAPCKKGFAFKACVLFYGIAFITSGAVNYLGKGVLAGLFVPVGAYIIIFAIGKNIKKKRCRTVLCYKGKKITEDGFYDSGNMLTSGGAPVILGSPEIFERLFGKGFSVYAPSEWADECDIRIIPYNTLGKNGTALGIRLDFAEICGRKYFGAVLLYSKSRLSESLILNSAML